MFTTSGASLDNLITSSQGSTQKRNILLIPTIKRMDALKKVVLCLSLTIFMDAHGRLGSMCCNHSQQTHRAVPKSLRSRTPRPLSCSGHWTCFHATRHLPPCTMSVLVQRKVVMIFFKALRNQSGRPKLIDVQIRIVDIVILIRVRRPEQ
jgi:hypothetical protein